MRGNKCLPIFRPVSAATVEPITASERMLDLELTAGAGLNFLTTFFWGFAFLGAFFRLSKCTF